MKNFRRLMGAALALMGIGHSIQNADANDRIVIQQFPGAFANASSVIAAEKGFCEKVHIECVIKFISTGPLGVQALVGKSIDAAFSATEVFVSAIAAGVKIKIVYGGKSNVSYALLARNDLVLPHLGEGYPSFMKDLKNKKIGVASRGSGTELYLLSLLANAGLSTKDVTIVPVGGPATGYTALVVAKQVDALVIFSPVKQICEAEQTCRVLLDNDGDLSRWPKELQAMIGATGSIAMRTDFIEANSELVDRFISALSESTRWIKDPANRDEFERLMRKHISVGDFPHADEIAKRTIRDELEDMGDGKTSRPALVATTKFLLENGQIQSPPAVSALIYDKAP